MIYFGIYYILVSILYIILFYPIAKKVLSQDFTPWECLSFVLFSSIVPFVRVLEIFAYDYYEEVLRQALEEDYYDDENQGF